MATTIIIIIIIIIIIVVIMYMTTKLIATLSKRSSISVNTQAIDPNVLFAIWKWMIDRILVAIGQDSVSYVRHHCVNADLVTDAECIRMSTPLHEEDVGRIFHSGTMIPIQQIRIENISIINTSQDNASYEAQLLIQQYPEIYPILYRIMMGTIPHGTMERVERIVKTPHYITWIMVRCQVYPDGHMDVFINLISGPPDLTPIHITAILIICKKIGYSTKDQEYVYLLDDAKTYY